MKLESRSLLENVLHYGFYQFWALGMGSFWFWSRVWKTGSPLPDPATSRTVGLGSHGDWVYVEPWQSQLVHYGLFGSVFAGLMVGFLMERFLGRAAMMRFRPLPFGLAVMGAIIFWTAAVRLGGM